MCLSLVGIDFYRVGAYAANQASCEDFLLFRSPLHLILESNGVVSVAKATHFISLFVTRGPIRRHGCLTRGIFRLNCGFLLWHLFKWIMSVIRMHVTMRHDTSSRETNGICYPFALDKAKNVHKMLSLSTESVFVFNSM